MKKHIYSLLILLALLVLVGCKKDSETTRTVGDTGITFSIENGQGTDLLDRETPGYIDTAKVTVFGVDKDNKKYPIYEPLMAASRGFGVLDKKYAEPYTLENMFLALAREAQITRCKQCT